MIDILSSLQVVLREAGFTLKIIVLDRAPVVRFEDDSLMGFGCVFDSPGDLLDRWRATELALLNRYANNFRAAGEKAWNVYSVFLSGAHAGSVQSRQVRWIEEDLELTRKIAACGIVSREELIRALLPILPLQYHAVLQAEDVTERLRRQIYDIAPRVSDTALDDAVPASEVVRILGELK